MVLILLPGGTYYQTVCTGILSFVLKLCLNVPVCPCMSVGASWLQNCSVSCFGTSSMQCHTAAAIAKS